MFNVSVMAHVTSSRNEVVGLSPVNNYKKLEHEVVEAVEKKVRGVSGAIVALVKRIHHMGKQRFTVMFIPHSEKKIFNFQISVYSLTFFLFLIGLLLVVFFVLSTHVTSSDKLMAEMNKNLSGKEKGYNELREEIRNFSRATQKFFPSLQKLVAAINPEMADMLTNTNAGGARLPLFLSEDYGEQEGTREIHDLRQLSLFLENAIEPLESIYSRVAEQNKIFVDIPTLWPLKNYRGFITFGFGPQVNPFNFTWYIHRGIDITFRRGAEIQATASGKVLRADFDPAGYGKYVEISHKFGFSTLYAHMDTVLVEKGQWVERGDVIGYLGGTGRVTGPHLHYEVKLGNQNIDPKLFVDLENTTNFISHSGNLR
jgi:murein DD-endopeptidase MepM/ murein hydrolase activator NlpD